MLSTLRDRPRRQLVRALHTVQTAKFPFGRAQTAAAIHTATTAVHKNRVHNAYFNISIPRGAIIGNGSKLGSPVGGFGRRAFSSEAEEDAEPIEREEMEYDMIDYKLLYYLYHI
jgi:hypothetical protein